jgi:hypothetical protein
MVIAAIATSLSSGRKTFATKYTDGFAAAGNQLR